MLKKIACIIILIQTATLYKLKKPALTYWEWLVERLKTKGHNDFQSKCIIRFLFLDALDRNDGIGYCYIYEKYASVLSEKKLPAKYYVSIFNASVQQNNRYLANNIKTIIDKDPDYFPIEFRNSFEVLYNETFS